VPDPENGNVQVVVRRRRTHRHRRNRLIRRWCAVLVLSFFVASASTVALRYFTPSLFLAQRSLAPALEQASLGLNNAQSTVDQVLSQARNARTVYPYSVVPGGVENVRELKWVAEHDPIVAAHYAGFDYAHAQVVRLTLARTVYVSYRIGNNIYWSRRRITLKKGENLITDGRMTARTRCANRVEETPQQAAAPAEPPAEKFDQPIRPGEGTAMMSPPVRFESALMPRQETPGLEPGGPLSLYDPFVGGSFIALAPPPLPEGLCAPGSKNKGQAAPAAGGKKKPTPCGSATGPAIVPEPGTWLLFGTGLLFIAWHARHKLAQARVQSLIS
jgi:hypothetical protein